MYLLPGRLNPPLPFIYALAAGRGGRADGGIADRPAVYPHFCFVRVAYTKAALRSFTRSLRYQVETSAPHVRVQEVIPPLVDTRMTAGRGTGKVSPSAVAEALVTAIERNTDEYYA